VAGGQGTGDRRQETGDRGRGTGAAVLFSRSGAGARSLGDGRQGTSQRAEDRGQSDQTGDELGRQGTGDGRHERHQAPTGRTVIAQGKRSAALGWGRGVAGSQRSNGRGQAGKQEMGAAVLFSRSGAGARSLGDGRRGTGGEPGGQETGDGQRNKKRSGTKPQRGAL